MANVCNNIMYVESSNKVNLDTTEKFFEKYFGSHNYSIDYIEEGLDIFFDSKWTFPEELMEELFEAIPDKSDIYMRCLSVEYGCMYHALWECDEDGWHEC